MTATQTQTRTYHLNVEYEVAFNDITDERIAEGAAAYACPPNETWEYHVQQVSRALWANPAILDTYLAHSTAWDLLLDLGAEGDGLCQALGVPEHDRDLWPVLLGLHLPPATRAFLKEMQSRDADKENDDESPFAFNQALGEVLALDWTGAGHHLAHAAD